ncbi:carboxypeptidase regulatory-like domain-containing protein [Planctomyces sp. SH-PL14]|uniref:carboxypeptidase regulatory-like domain-containing protein n=1 Tax=Planctomyces sp. SH-PL14 TaxID=1632864 RepID=UPI0009EE017B|nr:carboxypeptidase regulatory-like domain-containing protein [Planctomyces sp. SH-PL14]
MMNVVLRLNEWAPAWWSWFVAGHVAAAGVLAVAATVWFLVRRRASPRWGYLLFLLVPLKLLTPVEFPLPAPVAAWLPSFAIGPAGVPSTATVVEPAPQPAVPVDRAPLSSTSRPQPSPVSDAARPIAVSAPPSTPTLPKLEAAPIPATVARPPRASFSWRAVLMVAWAFAVAGLATRFAWVQWAFHRQLRRAAPAEAPWTDEFASLTADDPALARVRLLETDLVRSPAVWGIRTPRILLPPGLAATLTAGQRRWVLLHELAHIRRHDLAIQAALRGLQIVHFTNPALWIARSVLDRLRELAADDLASAQHAGNFVERGEAFLGVVRWAAQAATRSAVPALALFDSRSGRTCAARLQRLLDTDAPAPTTRLRGWSIATLAILAALCLPHLTGAQSPAQPSDKPAPPKIEPQAAPAPATRRFEVLIVGPDDKPVPKAKVELRLIPGQKTWTFHRGEFVKAGRYGTFAQADETGRLAVDLPARGTQYFNVDVTTPGFGPFWAGWDVADRSDQIPDQYTIHLDAGARVGGVVVDEEGRPVEGVSVHPHIEFKKRDEDQSQLGVGDRVKTDAAGRWTYESVPASLDSVGITLDHPQYLSESRVSLSLKEFSVPAGGTPERRITIARGIVATGRVVDREGKPVAGARVRGQFINAQREAMTDDRGEYRLAGCRPGRFDLVVTAAGHGPALENIDFQPDLAPAHFTLPAPRTIRVKMVDADGKPVPKFRVFFQNWRGDDHRYGLDKVLSYADEKGVWEWNEAPEDAVIADIAPPTGMQLSEQRLVARDEPYVFISKPSLHVNGRVVDQATGQPIPAFRVVLGEDLGNDQFIWDRKDSFDGKDGAFYYRTDYPRPNYRFRIEAPGYQTADTRNVRSDEGSIEVRVELRQGKRFSGVVVTPDGRPAEKATVVIGLNRTQIRFLNGEFSESGSYCDRRTTGAKGEFEIPSQTGPFELIVVHPSGAAWVPLKPDDALETIRLEPWAVVQGMVRVGAEPAADVLLKLSHHSDSYAEGRPNVSFDYHATSARDGSFRWDRVLPGKGTVVRIVRHHIRAGGESQTYSHHRTTEFPKGETTEVQIGGTGRPVTGLLVAPADLKVPFDWNFSSINVEPVGPLPPPPPEIPADVEADEAKRQKWWQAYMATPQGIAYRSAYDAFLAQREAASRFSSAVNRDGTFRINDIPPGEYELTAELSAIPSDAVNAFAGPLGRLKRTFTVPPIEGDRTGAALDLGTLEMVGAGAGE